MYIIYNNKNNIYKIREDSKDGFRKKKRVKEKRLRDKRRHPLEKPSGNYGPSNKPAHHTFRKIKRKIRWERNVWVYPHTRVLDSKTVEGHGTEAMAPSMRQKQDVITTQWSIGSHDGRRASPPWASILILQSVEEIPQLKGVKNRAVLGYIGVPGVNGSGEYLIELCGNDCWTFLV